MKIKFCNINWDFVRDYVYFCDEPFKVLTVTGVWNLCLQ
jgi:hypothetical protein